MAFKKIVLNKKVECDFSEENIPYDLIEIYYNENSCGATERCDGIRVRFGSKRTPNNFFEIPAENIMEFTLAMIEMVPEQYVDFKAIVKTMAIKFEKGL